jgi:ankyrin repeat protein
VKHLDEEGHNHLLWLCRNGMLFEVQIWLNEGNSTLRPEGKRTSALISAAEMGFHSLVQVLLERGEFEPEEKQ